MNQKNDLDAYVANKTRWVIVADISGFNYYLHFPGNNIHAEFSYEGLSDNATQFHSKIMAEQAYKAATPYTKHSLTIKPIIKK